MEMKFGGLVKGRRYVMTCKDCIGYKFCSKERNGQTKFYGKEIACNNVEDLCNDFKNKLTIFDIPDDTIMYVQGKWLVLNMESEQLGETIKRCTDYCSGGRK